MSEEIAEVTTTELAATEAAVEATDSSVEATTEAVSEVPESYEFEGIDGAIPEALEAYKEVARELGLNNEKAQSVLSKVLPAMAAAQEAREAAIRSEWSDKSSSDKEFGGAALQENLAVAKRALDTLGSPELTTFLNESGLGNHPEIIRAFYRAGKLISEDNKIVTGGSGVKSQSIAQQMYPNMNP